MFSQIRAIRREAVLAANEGYEVATRFHEQAGAPLDLELYHSLANLEALQEKWLNYGNKWYRRPIRWVFSRSLIKQVNVLSQEIVTYKNADVTARVNVLLFKDGVNRISGLCLKKDQANWNYELNKILDKYEDVQDKVRSAEIKYGTMIATQKLAKKTFRHSELMISELNALEARNVQLREELFLLFERYCSGKNIPFPDLY